MPAISQITQRLFIATSLLLALLFNPASVAAREASLAAWPGGRATPALALTDLDGKPWQLNDLRGKVVVVNFWASWCEPCIEEIRFLSELARSEPYRGRLVVLGVNYRESASLLRQAAATHDIAYPVLPDPSGETFRKWDGVMLPTTVLVDRRGKARWRVVGALDSSDNTFRQTLERMLRE
jgi:thiol-disulfide isomerase/thioredoxin